MNEAVQHTNYRATGSVLVISVTCFGLLQGSVLPILSTIRRDLDSSQSTVTWVLTAFLLSASISTPIFGRFGDLYGKKRMLVITLIVLSLGCVLAGLSHSITLLI